MAADITGSSSNFNVMLSSNESAPNVFVDENKRNVGSFTCSQKYESIKLKNGHSRRFGSSDSLIAWNEKKHTQLNTKKKQIQKNTISTTIFKSNSLQNFIFITDSAEEVNSKKKQQQRKKRKKKKYTHTKEHEENKN